MKKKLTREANNARLGTFIIIAAMVIVFGAVFVWMYRVDMLFLPDFIENLIKRDDGSEINFNMGELSELVKEGKNEKGETVTFFLTYDNLKKAFLTEKPSEGIAVTAKITHFNGDKAAVRNVKLYRFGELYRSEVGYPDGGENVEILKIADSVNMTVIDTASGRMYTLPRAADITPESETGIPSVEAVMEAVAAFPDVPAESADSDSAAENVEGEPVYGNGLTGCDIRMIRDGDRNVYYISFEYSDISVREEYFVSLSYGTVLSARTEIDGVTVYSYEVISMSLDPDVYSAPELYTVSEPEK